MSVEAQQPDGLPGTAWARLTTPVAVGRLTLPPIGLMALASVGALLLLVVATTRWWTPSDEHAYWLAGYHLLHGEPVYDPSAVPGTPYAFWYPPSFAQVMAPVAAVLSSEAFSIAWTILLLVCLFWLGGRRILVAVALLAFIPVAVELWYRNVHLLLAVLVVLGIQRWSWMFSVAAAIKMAPALGIVYLGARGRWREAAIAAVAGAALLGLSLLFGFNLWQEFWAAVGTRSADFGASLVPVPFPARFVCGLGLAVVAGRLSDRIGQPLLVVAIVVAMPTFWTTTLSLLIAIVPIAIANRARAVGLVDMPGAPVQLGASSPTG